MNISCHKREKTPKYSEKQAEKAKICVKTLPTYYLDRHVAWFWTMKNILLMMAPTCKETKITTQMTNLNVQVVIALLEKRNIRTK